MESTPLDLQLDTQQQDPNRPSWHSNTIIPLTRPIPDSLTVKIPAGIIPPETDQNEPHQHDHEGARRAAMVRVYGIREHSIGTDGSTLKLGTDPNGDLLISVTGLKTHGMRCGFEYNIEIDLRNAILNLPAGVAC